MNWGDLFGPKNDDFGPNLLPEKTCTIPMLGQVMSATRGATDAFSGVSKHLTKFGAKSIEAGNIGCGVGFGHGFGVGLSAKPGMVHQIQCCVIETMAKLMMKFGKAPGLPFIGGAFPVSFRSGWTTMNEPSRNTLGNMNQIVSKLADSTSQGLPGSGITSRRSTFGTRTEKVLSSFLQNPVFNEDEPSQNELAARLPTENNMLQLVMKHQQIIELLMEENRKLHQILTEDLNIPTSKLQTGYLSKTESPCSDCFFCRRKQRRNRR
ncbi:Calretinin [Gossypium australe]|uniref:Calretinin n=1 Tax=Gossypium australe TaxID=47621 RepID=A0A5B6UJV6_9ROSI|nr:Calretinin [Gossypium australe]